MAAEVKLPALTPETAADVSFRLLDGSAMRITTRKVVSGRHQPLNGVGITPDEAAGWGDAARAAAMVWLAATR